MTVKKIKISLTSLSSGATYTTIDIPIDLKYQIVDNSELIEREFVEKEIEKAINPILDYDRVRFIPMDDNNNEVEKIIYSVNFLTPTNTFTNTYSSIGFENVDIKFRKNSFKETFMNLLFYDSDNPLTQKLVTYTTLFANLAYTDLVPISSTNGIPGIPKDVTQIPVRFILENPSLNPRGFAEGFYLYNYKDELAIGESKFLYMRASFKNAKTGKSTNMVVKNTPQKIDKLVHELYTRYILTRTTTGYYYSLDQTYQGNGIGGSNNTQSSPTEINITLYEINAL